MLKLGLKYTVSLKYTRMVSVLFLGITALLITSFNTKHPFYMSTIDIKHDVKQQSLNISVRMFTSDLEDALRKSTSKPIDILHPKNKSDVDSVLFHYIKKRLIIQINSKSQMLYFIGYEKDDESIWSYLEVKNVVKPKTFIINTKLLYDYLPQQINIIHAEVNAIKKSSKVTNPQSKVEFTF